MALLIFAVLVALPAHASETGCCEKFNPALWDGKEITWKDKLFVKDHVVSFFHMPLNFGAVVARDIGAIESTGALDKEMVILADEKSLWGADIFIAVAKDVPGRQTVKISGTFLTKVFEGNFKNMPTWIKDMETYAASKGKRIKKMYFYYTTCPKCAKIYGKNYVVILAQI